MRSETKTEILPYGKKRLVCPTWYAGDFHVVYAVIFKSKSNICNHAYRT